MLLYAEIVASLVGPDRIPGPHDGARAASAAPVPTRGGRPAETPSFREIYEQHFQFVWRALRRLGVSERDVADVTQSVFVIAHRKLPEFEGRSSLSTWLFGISQRVAKDFRNSARVRRERLSAVEALESVSDSPESAIEQRRLADVAQRLLDRLPEEQRLAFLLFELEGMSGEQIAELTKVSVGTVRSRLRLAREAFRREVEKLGRGEDEAQIARGKP